MKIAIAGYSGFIGASYMEHRSDLEFVPLSRSLLYGDIQKLSEALKGCDVLLNLAGSSIGKRWTRKRKREILKSRKEVNANLVEAVKRLKQKPKIFISASAIGLYSSNGVQTEENYDLDNSFLSRVVQEWEAPLKGLNGEVNYAILRIGLVLGKGGGALVPLLKMARWRVLVIFGAGRQFFSFIHLHDLHRSIDFILSRELTGIFNLSSPFPVDNATFTKTLAELTGTRLIFRIPAFIFKIVLGEAHILITEGPKVLPDRLTREDFRFEYPSAGEALSKVVKSIEKSH